MEYLQKSKSFFVDKELVESMSNLEDTNKNLSILNSKLMEPIVDQVSVVGGKTVLGKDLLTDIEMFENYKVDATASNETVFDAINKTFTLGGEMYLKHLISNPINNIDVLKKRQDVINKISLSNVEPMLFKLKETEASVAWLFNIDKEELFNLYDMVYFSTFITRPLNAKSKALTTYNLYRIIASPTIGIISPVCYVIVPFIIMRKKLGLSISFASFIKYMFKIMLMSDNMFIPTSLSSLKYLSLAFTLLFYFQGIINSLELASATNKICKMITNKINGFVTFINTAHELKEYVDSSTFYSGDVLSKNSSNPFKDISPSEYSWFSNFGTQLSIFKRIKREEFKPIINYIYAIDSIVSIKRLSLEPEFSFITYKESTKPYMFFNNVWHPSLKKHVSNTITLGDTNVNNIIITGPNAGGKSTIIKSILINSLLSQTITLGSFGAGSEIVPYYLINSQINIPDCKGKESLFEAEMYRSKQNVDDLKGLDKNQFALIVMDEIFNSTNPVEGIAGAYAIAKHMSLYSNANVVITTHYLYLTKLSKEFPGHFSSWKMNVDIDDKNNITYPYKLKKGISRQYIALELLRKNGFEETIINDAITIKQRLVQPALKET